MPIRKARQVAAELALALVAGTDDADKKGQRVTDSNGDSGSKTTEDGTDSSQASTGKMTAVCLYRSDFSYNTSTW